VTLSEGDIVEIEGILGMHVTADHAIPAVYTGTLGYATMGVEAVWTGVDGNLQQVSLPSGHLGSLTEGCGARRQLAALGRLQRDGIEHILDQAIVWVEDLAGHLCGPATLKGALGGFDLNVEVDQRAAPHSARLNYIDGLEAPVVEEASIPLVPERVSKLPDRPRELSLPPTSSSLEDTNGAASLS
jgi:hypothetical protein